MVMKSVPPAPLKEDMGAVSWQRWFSTVANNSVAIYSLSASLTPASVAAQTTAEQTFTVTGINSSDSLLTAIKPTNTAGIGITGFRVTGNNTIAIDYINATAAPIVPPAESYTFILIR